jgi:hypothetical protein
VLSFFLVFLQAFIFAAIRVTCPAHLILLDLIIGCLGFDILVTGHHVLDVVVTGSFSIRTSAFPDEGRGFLVDMKNVFVFAFRESGGLLI